MLRQVCCSFFVFEKISKFSSCKWFGYKFCLIGLHSLWIFHEPLAINRRRIYKWSLITANIFLCRLENTNNIFNNDIHMIIKFTISLMALLAVCSCHNLQHCINHILHESGNENFKCANDEDLHFYSTYVLPDGAYRCLEEMKNKKGFYVSTVKSFKDIVLTQEEIQKGVLVRQNLKNNGWKCNNEGYVKSAYFNGLQLFLSKCKHNEAEFQDICIIKGWPLQEIEYEDIL